MKVFLIGMPGAGKTTQGIYWAQKYHCLFYDLDHIIEHSLGQTITQYIMQQGEALFRLHEHQILQEVSHYSTSFIMAVGGGAPCYYNNIHLMNSIGKTILLDTPINQLVYRLQKIGTTSRPLLTATMCLEKQLQSTWIKRKFFYNQARIHYKM